ncbi:hypothetical protein GCM10009759_15880 [Kitasatospora saccharophila]|uniref:Uncharacterized protein n=1 Tax=Kitasatospora saccharophila TaxID=407973 RepID=A0ABN2WFY1_9ACTN
MDTWVGQWVDTSISEVTASRLLSAAVDGSARCSGAGTVAGTAGHLRGRRPGAVPVHSCSPSRTPRATEIKLVGRIDKRLTEY